jgi:hypothetical protein
VETANYTLAKTQRQVRELHWTVDSNDEDFIWDDKIARRLNLPRVVHEGRDTPRRVGVIWDM